jgi:hypothetical protein
MDIYGIGNALKSMVGFYVFNSRSTGRTTHLLQIVESGDRVIFSEDAHLRHFKERLREHGITGVELVKFPVNRNPLERLSTGQGQTYLDHNWIEDRYRWVLDNEARGLDSIQKSLSGYSLEHKRTAQAARDERRYFDQGLIPK